MTAIVLQWVHAPSVQLQWVGPIGNELEQLAAGNEPVAALVGPRGRDGAVANISNDAGQRLTIGTDGGLFIGNPTFETTQW